MKYRKVSASVWQDEKFRTFSDDGKLAFLYLLTHPAMTSVGAMRGTLAGLAAELGWTRRRLERALAPAIKSGTVEINLAAAFIGLPRFLKHNPPDNPNVVRGVWVRDILEHTPECRERVALIRRCQESLSGTYRETFDRAIAEPYPQGLPEPLPEQLGETVAVAVARAGAGGSPKPPSGGADEPLAWLSLLNDQAGTAFKPTESNLRPIRARLRDGHTHEEAKAVVATKVADWTGTEFAKFLRPSTLFGPKFDGYLQASRNGHDSRRVNDAWQADEPRDG